VSVSSRARGCAGVCVCVLDRVQSTTLFYQKIPYSSKEHYALINGAMAPLEHILDRSSLRICGSIFFYPMSMEQDIPCHASIEYVAPLIKEPHILDGATYSRWSHILHVMHP